MKIFRKIALSLLALATFSPAALAQRDMHLYGGATIGGKEYTKGFLVGVGIQNNRTYVSMDGHSLGLDEEGKAAFQQIARGTGTSGLDVSYGNAVFVSERFSVIPVGIGGYTGGEFCSETVCDDGSQFNYGGGVVAAVKGVVGRYGLHAGVRYTRNYGAAVTFGLVF